MHPHPGRGGHQYEAVAESAASAAVGGGLLLLTLVLLALAAFHLWRKGLVGRPAAVAAPEENAKKILADRFARGQIGGDDFMERAALLNWTPGVTPVSQAARSRRL